jgi:hypothetical protein
VIYKATSSDMGTNEMRRNGEDQKEEIRPELNRSIMMDLQGAQITSDVGFRLLRQIDERFGILGPSGNHLEDSRSPLYTKHSLLHMARQRVRQIEARYEDCNDAGLMVLEPALNRSNKPLTWPKGGSSDCRTIFGNPATWIRGSRPIRELVNGPKQRVLVRSRNNFG